MGQDSYANTTRWIEKNLQTKKLQVEQGNEGFYMMIRKVQKHFIITIPFNKQSLNEAHADSKGNIYWREPYEGKWRQYGKVGRSVILE